MRGCIYCVYGRQGNLSCGDLNWWHWEEETESYNEQMRQDYQREIDKLKDIVIDIAFVPLDPRQENQYAWGMDYFMKHTHTKYVFPMHMWEITKFMTSDGEP